MTLYLPERLEVLVDWNDNGMYDHIHSDITDHVQSFRVRHGSTVTTGKDFRLGRSSGSLVLHKRFVDVRPLLSLQSHRITFRYDGRSVFTGVAEPFQGTRVRIRGVNDRVLRQVFPIQVVASIPISQFWYDYLKTAGIANAGGQFDDYETSPFILKQIQPLAFFREFGKLFGGYVYELHDGAVGFQSAQLATDNRAKISLSAATSPITEWDLFGKVGSSLTRVTGTIQQVSTDIQQITTQEIVNLFPGHPQEFQIEAAAGTIVNTWEVALEDTDETEIIFSISSQTLTTMTFSATNIGSTPKPSETAVISGEVQRAEALRVVAAINLESEFVYGRSDVKVEPWAEGDEPINTLLSLRSTPVPVANMVLPVTANNKDVLFIDTGSVIGLSVSGRDIQSYDGEMLLGRREIQYQRKVTTVKWHMIDLGLTEFSIWTFGDPKIRLGFNSFLTGPIPTGENVITSGGVRITSGGTDEFVTSTYSE